jgi:sortase A
MSRSRMIYLCVVIFLLLAASWHIGQGLYIHAKAMLAQALLERAWVKTIHGEHEVKPWPWADTWPVARLSVPRLNISLIVLAGDSGRTLAFGPGHNSGSAMPGSKGNSLVSGHRDTHFRFLQYLQPGDVVCIETSEGHRMTYRVESTAVIDARQAWLKNTLHTSRLNLVTCFPFDAIVPGGNQRYLVSALAVISEPYTKLSARKQQLIVI